MNIFEMEEGMMMGKKRIHHLRLFSILLIAAILLLGCNLINILNTSSDPAETSPTETVPGEISEEQSPPEEEEVQGESEPNEVEEQVHEPEEGTMVQGHEDQWVNLNDGGMGFWYDANVILDIQADVIAYSEGGPYETAYPAYMQYSLLLDSGAVSVVEIEVYKNTTDVARTIFPDLEALIANKNTQGLDCIPQLPLLSFFHECSHQQFISNVAFRDFANGSGVRFVTVYAIQDWAAVSNENLVYVYQGITEDQQCYVFASFRFTHQQLDEYADIPADIYADPTGAAIEEYFADYENMFNSDQEGFQPSLERFDLIISSIEATYCSGG